MWDNKSRELKDKRVSVGDAVERSMHDGDLLTFGGFGHVRVSMAFAYEIICQRWRDLAVLTKTGVHDVDLLIGAGCVRMVEVAYVFGHELRGLSPACRRRRGDRGRG